MDHSAVLVPESTAKRPAPTRPSALSSQCNHCSQVLVVATQVAVADEKQTLLTGYLSFTTRSLLMVKLVVGHQGTASPKLWVGHGKDRTTVPVPAPFLLNSPEGHSNSATKPQATLCQRGEKAQLIKSKSRATTETQFPGKKARI